ncbi:hypothetical protein NL676_015132 [Syzygium grande]|nr:hypothetical protein NL676_015132 [Syzygium grande]
MDGWMDGDHSEFVERLSRPFLTYPLLHLPGSPLSVCCFAFGARTRKAGAGFRWPLLDLVLYPRGAPSTVKQRICL